MRQKVFQPLFAFILKPYVFNLLFLIHFSPILCNKKLVIALKRYENHTFPFYTFPC